jgi:hypothetical protein
MGSRTQNHHSKDSNCPWLLVAAIYPRWCKRVGIVPIPWYCESLNRTILTRRHAADTTYYIQCKSKFKTCLSNTGSGRISTGFIRLLIPCKIPTMSFPTGVDFANRGTTREFRVHGAADSSGGQHLYQFRPIRL